jgi:hypothetical protein
MQGFITENVIEEYDEDAQFCCDCTEDIWLNAKIRLHGSEGLCSVCKAEDEPVISFGKLAEWLEEIWRQWFHVGTEYPNFSNDSDRVHYEQHGDDAVLLISELIKCSLDDEVVTRSLIALMARGDDREIMDGGEPLIDDGQLYQHRKLIRSEVDLRWTNFVLNLKHHTRYFNNNALELLHQLFDELRDVHVSNSGFSFLLASQKEDRPVVLKYESRSLVVFRARKVDSPDDQLKIIESPDSELSNPPDRLAKEGRMNAKGISYFYGAEDRETCVAELRPSLSDKAISAEFEVIESVQLLDLTLLSDAHHKHPESMFDDKYSDKRIHRQLLRQLHWLIAQPVSDGNSLEYLPTQVMAEYLARCTNPKIDGVIFESVQRKGGRNIVFFPHVLNKTNHSATDFTTTTSAIRLKPNTLVLHETTQIEYCFKHRKIVDREIEGAYEGCDRDYDDYL